MPTGNEKRYPANITAKGIAIVLRCPDRRLPGPHGDFLNQELGLHNGETGGNYFSLKQAGAAISLARAEQLPEEFRATMDEICLFLELSPEITHIILINHENCRKYNKVISDEEKCKCPHHEREDLVRASSVLMAIFPNIQVGAYFARFVDASQKEVYFETVFETDPKKSLRKATP